MSVKMIRDGSEEGYPTEAFDKEKRQMYRLDSLGKRHYTDVPEGFTWNTDGTKLEPTKKPAGPDPSTPSSAPGEPAKDAVND